MIKIKCNLKFTFPNVLLFIKFINFGDWGLGIGDWGLGIGPIPNPQSPIPMLINFKALKCIKIL